MAQWQLEKLAKAVQAMRDAEAERNRLIVEARESGEKVRDIARYAQLSRQRINQILREGP